MVHPAMSQGAHKLEDGSPIHGPRHRLQWNNHAVEVKHKIEQNKHVWLVNMNKDDQTKDEQSCNVVFSATTPWIGAQLGVQIVLT